MIVYIGKIEPFDVNIEKWTSYVERLGECFNFNNIADTMKVLFVCVEVLRPSQPSGVMSSAVSLPNHTFTGQA